MRKMDSMESATPMNSSHRRRAAAGRWLRARTWAVAGSLLLLVGAGSALAGCGGAPAGDDPDEMDMDNDPPPNNMQAISWPGTWNVAASYTSLCTVGGGGSPNITAQNHTNTLVLEATSAGGFLGKIPADYEMTGTGNATSLTLSGEYPGRDMQGKIAGTFVANQNMVTITIDKVIDNNKVTGKITGSYKTTYTCNIQNGNGKITMTR